MGNWHYAIGQLGQHFCGPLYQLTYTTIPLVWLASPSTHREGLVSPILCFCAWIWLSGFTVCTNQIVDHAKNAHMTLMSKRIMQSTVCSVMMAQLLQACSDSLPPHRVHFSAIHFQPFSLSHALSNVCYALTPPTLHKNVVQVKPDSPFRGWRGWQARLAWAGMICPSYKPCVSQEDTIQKVLGPSSHWHICFGCVSPTLYVKPPSLIHMEAIFCSSAGQYCW